MKSNDLLKAAREGMSKLVTTGEFQRYLDTMRRFHDYSWGNQLLIMIQNPDATRVAGYVTWQKLKRQVKGGAKGIAILAPNPYKEKVQLTDGTTDERVRMFYRTVYVFDVSQTEGEPLPTMMKIVEGDDAAPLYALLKTVGEAEGLEFVKNEMPTAWGWYSKSRNQIAVSDDKPVNTQAQTIAHELAHWALEHDGSDGRSVQVKELEAESVAYLVCADYGLDIGETAWAYLLGWAKDIDNGIDMLADSMGRIHDAYNKLIQLSAVQEQVAA